MPKASRDVMATKKQREKSIVTKQEELRAKHEHFANLIMEGHEPAQAARACGYAPSTAYNVMKNEEVQLMLHKARTEIEDISKIRRIDVLNMFLDAVEMARTLADPGQMINGADKIAKFLGYYEPERIEITHLTDKNVLASKLKGMSDEELYAIASQKAKVIEGEVAE